MDQALLEGAYATAEIAALRDVDEVVKPNTKRKDLSADARFVALYDSTGALVANTGSFEEAPKNLQSITGRTEFSLYMPFELSGKHLLRAVVVPVGQRNEHLLFALSWAGIEEDLAFLGQVLTLLFLCSTGFAALVARWLGTALTKDVNALAEVARTVARGELSARADKSIRNSDETASLSDDLNHMIAQLDELVSTQRLFVSHAAHELRSPLATLRGELQLSLRRPRQAEEYRQTIQELLDEVTSLCTLSEDLLTLARAQKRSKSENAITTTVGEILRNAVHMSRGLADENNVTILHEASDVDGTAVTGAANDLARALRNLVDNAISHSPPGKAVKLHTSIDNQRVNIAVIDQGNGVRHDEAQAIFSPFFRSAANQSSKGAGLGLAIAREIARSCGGDVTLDEHHTKGAKFVLTLVVAKN